MERFTGSFTQQEPIPDAGIEAALAVLRHGRIHRYNTAPDEIAETALLEEEFAALTGAKYCLAVASGGYALGCALRAVGLAHGEPVVTNAFTLAPVPGAIAAAGGSRYAGMGLRDLCDQLHSCYRDNATAKAMMRMYTVRFEASAMAFWATVKQALMRFARPAEVVGFSTPLLLTFTAVASSADSCSFSAVATFPFKFVFCALSSAFFDCSSVSWASTWALASPRTAYALFTESTWLVKRATSLRSVFT